MLNNKHIDELEAQAVRLNFVDLAGSEKSQQFNGSKGKNDRFAVRCHYSILLNTNIFISLLGKCSYQSILIDSSQCNRCIISSTTSYPIS